MAIVQVSIVPLGTKTTSISDYVAQALKVLQNQKSVSYKLTPMGTVLEGDLDKVLSMVRQMHESVFSEGVQRVLTIVNRADRTPPPPRSASCCPQLNMWQPERLMVGCVVDIVSQLVPYLAIGMAEGQATKSLPAPVLRFELS